METEDDKQAWQEFTRLIKPEDNFANKLVMIDLAPDMFFPSGNPFTIRIPQTGYLNPGDCGEFTFFRSIFFWTVF